MQTDAVQLEHHIEQGMLDRFWAATVDGATVGTVCDRAMLRVRHEITIIQLIANTKCMHWV